MARPWRVEEDERSHLTHADMAQANEIMRVQTGSEVYGISLGTSDRDEMGVFIEPKEYVMGLSNYSEYRYRTAATGQKSGPGDLDLVIYSLRKFVSLLEKGNPSIILGLFTPGSYILKDSLLGQHLRERRAMFISNEMGKRFLGYLDQQRKKALGQWAHGDTTQRPGLVEQYGFDTKFAAHMVRLGYMGLELLEWGTVSMPMAPNVAQWILDLRRGEHTLQDALAWVDRLERRIEGVMLESRWPGRVERAPINRLLVDMHEEWWAQ